MAAVDPGQSPAEGSDHRRHRRRHPRPPRLHRPDRVDGKQTLLCTYLSAVLLVGLALNATLGWSWADPIAALVIPAIAVKEGHDAWQGKGCCAPSTAAMAPTTSAEADACGCRPGCDCC